MIEIVMRRTLALARWLSLPVAVLLFLQWPLRDWLQAYSRETNDLGQCAYALFVGFGIVAATRARAHIRTGMIADAFSPTVRRAITRVSMLVFVLPWALFVAWAAAPSIMQSLRLAEHFPDTGNPGYFLIKLALGVMLLAMLLQALRDIVTGGTQ